MFPVFLSAVLLTNIISPTTAREELQVRKQEVTQNAQLKREEFRERVAQIRDERKQQIVENLAARIVIVNNKWVNHWDNVLSRLESILEKIKQRAPEADISAAQAAIEAAYGAVNTQSEKVYNIVITDEDNLGQSVRNTLNEFHEDLREVQALIKTAREEVVKVLRSIE